MFYVTGSHSCCIGTTVTNTTASQTVPLNPPDPYISRFKRSFLFLGTHFANISFCDTFHFSKLLTHCFRPDIKPCRLTGPKTPTFLLIVCFLVYISLFRRLFQLLAVFERLVFVPFHAFTIRVLRSNLPVCV